jgi:type IV secretion system protein TrbC
MRNFEMRNKKSIVTAMLFNPVIVFAAQTGNNSWEKALLNLSDSLTGPVAYAISLIAIVMCGVTMAFADLQGGGRRFVQAACGLSIAFFATQIVTSFLGFNGAVI